MSIPLNYNAYEIRQLLHAQPFVGTVQDNLFGVIKSITKLNLSNEEAVDTIWWPFIKKGFKDLCMYGFVVYYKKTKNGIVMPVHVPLHMCNINYSVTDGLKVTPKNADQSSVSLSRSNSNVTLLISLTRCPKGASLLLMRIPTWKHCI